AASTGASTPAIAAPVPLPMISVGGAVNRTTHGTPFAPHPLYGASALSVPEPKRRSASGWILLLLVLAGGTYAAMRWNQVVQAEREYAPLTVSAAKYYYAQAKSFVRGTSAQNGQQPDAQAGGADASQQNGAQDATPPDTSANNSQPDASPNETPDTEASQSRATPSASAKTAAIPAASMAHSSHSSAVSALTAARPSAAEAQDTPAKAATNSHPAMALAADHSAATPAKAPAKQTPAAQGDSALAAVQRRAEAAFGEPHTLSAPPVNDHSPSYLWIGRFQTEDRAQVTAKKVEDLGLPVVVIPRHTEVGRFYLVLSGPFGPERVGSVMEWLKEQGFAGIRVLKNPMRNGRLIPGVEQDPEN
ncbi:MAG: hypothetical protein ACRD3S_11520, partial [Terracidiphilus sp.]